MKVAVTGAAGFIGRHVIADLVARGIDAVPVYRHLPDIVLPGTSPVQLDTKDVNAASFELLGRPDALIHLAWEGLPNYRSLHHFESELPRQYRFLKTLVQAGLSSVVVTGTCFEYGMQSGELAETMDTRPNNPYGLAKDTLRRQIEFLRSDCPFLLSWARLFYLHGEGQAATSLLPQLQTAVERGETTFNMSGGEQLRDYMAVSEVARYLVDLALSEADQGVINISSGRPISVRSLVEGWMAEHGWGIQLNLGYYPYADYEPMAFWGNCAKLRNFLENKTTG